MHPLNSEPRKKRENFEILKFKPWLYSTARPPTTAAPITPQAAVCMGMAAPLEVEVVELVEEEPLWAEP
jgi:hypothetical protein